MGNSINTVEKGTLFEKRSLEIIKRAVDEGSLGIKENIRIREKPAYYSDDRNSDIIFDLSIEVWPPNAERFVLVYLIECKDYSKNIPVDDLEEFYSKVLQVAEGCSKPVFIANNAFQQGAYNYAESKRMMLIRAEEGTNHQIILHSINKKASELKNDSNNSLINETGIQLLGKIIDGAIDNAFKEALNPKILEANHNLDYLSKEEIEQKTKAILQEINPKIFKSGTPISASVLEKYIASLGISIVQLPRNSEYLGNCDIRNKKISVNSALINTDSYLFILAHELGHFILHQNLIISQEEYNDFPDPTTNFKTFKYAPPNPDNYEYTHLSHWIEWQANHFAASLILPDFALKARLWFCQEKLNMMQGKLYLTQHEVNNDNANKIIESLANYFSVTKNTIIFRLIETDLLEEYTNVKSIAEIIKGFTDSFIA